MNLREKPSWRLMRMLVPRLIRQGIYRKFFRGNKEEKALHDYERVSRLGLESKNEWIKKSAEIDGWLFDGEHEFLWDLASRPCEGHVLEIGTWMGKSTCILAGACIESARHTRVICIDPFDMQGTSSQEDYHKKLIAEAGTFYQFVKNARELGFIDWVLPIATTSPRALPFIPLRFRMVFVDGAHDYESVKQDVELSLPKLMRGGLLALHDAANTEWPDIGNYVEDHLRNRSDIRYFGNSNTIVAFEKMEDR